MLAKFTHSFRMLELLCLGSLLVLVCLNLEFQVSISCLLGMVNRLVIQRVDVEEEAGFLRV